MKHKLLLLSIVFLHSLTGAGEFRAPAVPLVTVDPFFSVWSPADKLTDQETTHWTGHAQAMSALLEIDGRKVRLMGKTPSDIPALPQTACLIRPTQTIYHFSGEIIDAELRFSTPMLPQDLDVFSRPVTYVTCRINAKDGEPHQIRFSYGITGSMATEDDRAQMISTKVQGKFGTALSVGKKDQEPLSYSGDIVRCGWGNAWISMPGQVNAEYSPSIQPAHAQRITLSQTMTASPKAETHVLLAYDDISSIQFFGENLPAWWKRKGLTFTQLLEEAEKDYPVLLKKMDAFDREFVKDLDKVGGEKYAQIAALSYRQSFAGCKLVAYEKNQPLYFSKENASNGCIGTVDVLYPQLPHLILMSPALTRATLAPIMLYASTPRWKHPFAPHDVGQYPLANGQVYAGGENGEQMPVEECGNMLISLAALSHAEGNVEFASRWWKMVTKWAEYLEKEGFDPNNQLCTDDFAGHLAHNANLSIKAILGIASYAKMAEMRGEKETASKYMDQARTMVKQWMQSAKGGKFGSYKLAFDKPDTWSMKYNLVWDRILGFNIFPKEVAQQEMAAYRKLIQPFGLPLDNRETWTKSDWTVWAATLTGIRADFDLLIGRLSRFLNETPDRIPFTDWYWAKDGRYRGFIARPVIGGVFLPMLYHQGIWKKYNTQAQRNTSAYSPISMIFEERMRTIVPEGRTSAQILWKYTTDQPPASWMQPDFNDSNWKAGPGGFGSDGTPGALCRTEWETPKIWLRRWINITEAPAQKLFLSLHHDEDAKVWFDGVFLRRYNGYTTDYTAYPLSDSFRPLFTPGKHLISIEVKQTYGGQYIDLGILEQSPNGELRSCGF